MFTVHLDKMKFFAHHGWHDEEGITGTEFEVSVSVSFNPEQPVATLADTINYIDIFEVVKHRFSQPTKLLETLATDITQEIRRKEERIGSVHITINKLNPPIGNFTGSAGISYSEHF